MKIDLDDVFYGKNEYLDKKWSVAQSFIMKIANGEFDLEMPENLGYDHIDAILLSLKMAAENLKDRDDFHLTIGALKGLNEGIALLDSNYNIVEKNLEFDKLTTNSFAIGENIFSNGILKDLNQDFVWKENDISFKKKRDVDFEDKVLEVEISNFSRSLGTKSTGFLISIKEK